MAQLQTIGGHPHVIHWHAAHSRADGAFLLAMELAHCDMLEVLHSAPQRGLGTSHRMREWMLQVATGTYFLVGGICLLALMPQVYAGMSPAALLNLFRSSGTRSL